MTSSRRAPGRRRWRRRRRWRETGVSETCARQTGNRARGGGRLNRGRRDDEHCRHGRRRRRRTSCGGAAADGRRCGGPAAPATANAQSHTHAHALPPRVSAFPKKKKKNTASIWFFLIFSFFSAVTLSSLLSFED